MVEEDVVDAIRLTDTMNWNLIRDDFELAMKLEPEGCFSVIEDTRLIGLAMTIRFEKLGWIGNVIVDPRHREKGVGSLLMRDAISYLKEKGATTIGLYSYMDTIPFYEQLGFKKDKIFVYLVGRGVELKTNGNIVHLSERDFEKALKIDIRGFGVSRERLLRELFLYSKDLCYGIYVDGVLKGFAMAKLSNVGEIGPIVTDASMKRRAVDLLEALLRRFIGFDVYIGTPANRSKIFTRLNELGFREDFKVMRMYYGDTPSDKRYVAAIESLERG